MHRRSILTGLGAMAALASSDPAAAAAPAAFKYTTVVLYLPSRAMVERGPTVDALVAYIKALTAAANMALSGAASPKGVSGSVVVGLKPPSRSRIWVVSAEPARQAKLDDLLTKPLEAVQAPAVKGYDAFALNFDAWGGGQSKIAFMPIPKVWRDALEGGPGGVLPDAVFDRIWKD